MGGFIGIVNLKKNIKNEKNTIIKRWFNELNKYIG